MVETCGRCIQPCLGFSCAWLWGRGDARAFVHHGLCMTDWLFGCKPESGVSPAWMWVACGSCTADGWCCTGPLIPGCVHGCVCVWMRGSVCMCKSVCVHAGMSGSVSVTVYTCEGGCVLADIATRAFNGVVSQPPSNVEAPIGWCCTGPPVPECVYGCVCVWMRVTVCMCKCACVQV